jgi:cysteine-rich repeat protein
MRMNRIAGSVLALAIGFGVPGGFLRDAGAASPDAAARKCRGAIAGGSRNVIGAGLGTIDACHARRDKGKFSGDCNVIPSNSTGFARAQARAEATINARCTGDNPVLANYPNGVATDVFPALKALVEQSGTEVQGAPDIAGDPSRKPKSKCHKAIGKGRSNVIKDVVMRSTGCQRKLDKKATTFGPLDPSCVASPGGSVSKARNSITKACNGITGTEVGSCAALPDCVLTEATTSGQAMAKAIYTATAPVGQQCGNGIVEGDEQCDDGNRNDADACRNDCTNGVCGDGVVATSLGEECDDGNTVPNDGCTDCKIDGATCGANGVTAVVSLIFNQKSIPLAGLEVNLGYGRAGVSIPGSLDDPSVLERVIDLTGRNVAFFVDKDTNADGIDDDLYNLYAGTDAIIPGPFEQVRFDCSPGAFIRPSDFDCTPANPSDTSGNSLNLSRDQLDCRVTQVASAGAVPATVTTTTATPTTNPPTTTPVPTTTTTTNAHVCGNGVVEGPTETCDDGNAVDENTVDPLGSPDACPASCRIETCNSTAQTVSVSVNFAAATSISGYKVFVDYPEGKVVIPGNGQPGPGVITNDATNSAVANDLDYGVIVVGSKLGPIAPPRLLTLNFTSCGITPTVADFNCKVHQANDTTGNDVPMTCSVSIP